MDELDERISLLADCGFVDATGADDLRQIASTVMGECGVSRDNEALGALVTHVAAALKRARDGEEIDPLPPEIVDDIKGSAVYPDAQRISRELLDSMTNKLSAIEEDFVLVHVGGLLLAQAGK